MHRSIAHVVGTLLVPALLLAGAGPSAPSASDATAPPLPQAVHESTTAGSVLFIQNAGQWSQDALFQVRGASQGTIWLAEDAIWLTVLDNTAPDDSPRQAFPELLAESQSDVPRPGVNIKLTFVGANPHPAVEPLRRLDTAVSYFLGSDRARWRPDVPVWGGVRYADIYPGVDLELVAQGGELKPHLAAQPGAHLGAVRLRVEGPYAVVVEGDSLHLSTSTGHVAWPLFLVDAQLDPPAVEVGQMQSFEVTSPGINVRSDDRIMDGEDPSPNDNPDDLIYGTFLGGGGDEEGRALAVDANGAAHVVGWTTSADFPITPGAFDTSPNGGRDVFALKLNPAGSALDYATFVGGGADDRARDVVVDAAGSAYITGETSSSDFPTTPGAFDTIYNGGDSDAFVIKLDATGSDLTYSTFLGGASRDAGQAIAVDTSGAAHVAGDAVSSNFPTTPGAYDTSHNGGYDAFVAKLDAAGAGLEFSTYLGGGADDFCSSVVTDDSGAVYVSGTTGSATFPTTPGAFDRTHNGDYDAYVAKLQSTGASLAYATFLGGSANDTVPTLDVTFTGAAHVTGYTDSLDFPTTLGAMDTSYNGAGDGFVARLDPSGASLAYATFLGGTSSDHGTSIAVDASGVVFVTGPTASPDFPTTSGSFDESHNGGTDCFVATLNSAGSALTYATFVGGSSTDSVADLVFDASARAHATGHTTSSDFPTTSGALDTTYNGGYDSYAFKLSVGATPGQVSRIYLPWVGLPLPNLMISDLEITQAVQTRDNAVPLVRDRPVVVRVYARSAGAKPVDDVVASLSATRDGVPLPGSPLDLGPQTVVLDPSPAEYSSSFNALLPSEWLSGDVSFTAVVDPADEIEETDETDNEATLQVQFNDVPPLSVMIVPVNYLHIPTGVFCPAPSFDSISDYVMRAYPFPSVDVSFHAPIDYSGDLTQPDEEGLLFHWVRDIKIADGAPASQIYYGLVPRYNSAGEYCGYSSGLAYLGVRVSIGADGANDGGGKLAAHEFGHNFGRWHAPCGDPLNPDPDYPYAGGSIGQFGLDIANAVVYDPADSFDIMSYCMDWVSDYTYEAVYEDQRANGAMQAPSPAQKSLFVRVSVDAAGQPTMLPVYVLQGIPTRTPQDSEYSIELVGTTGRSLSAYPVDLLHPEGQDGTSGSISALLPHPPQPVATVRLIRSGTNVLERELQDTLPALSLLARPTIEQAADRLVIRWGIAAAPAVVRYAADGSHRWTTIGIDVLSGVLSVDPSVLPGGSGTVEIALADYREAAWTLPLTLPLPDSPPDAWITGPVAIFAGESVVLFGHGDDREDGALHALEWSVNGVAAGNGKSLVLAGLGLGEHVIRLTVVDSAGNTAQAWHRIVVGDDLLP